MPLGFTSELRAPNSVSLCTGSLSHLGAAMAILTQFNNSRNVHLLSENIYYGEYIVHLRYLITTAYLQIICVSHSPQTSLRDSFWKSMKDNVWGTSSITSQTKGLDSVTSAKSNKWRGYSLQFYHPFWNFTWLLFSFDKSKVYAWPAESFTWKIAEAICSFQHQPSMIMTRYTYSLPPTITAWVTNTHGMITTTCNQDF